MITKRQQILNLLGLAKRANKLVLGTDPTLAAIRNQTAGIVFFPKDGGASQAKKLRDKSVSYGSCFCQLMTRDELVTAIGINRSVFAVADRGFTKKLRLLIEEEQQ